MITEKEILEAIGKHLENIYNRLQAIEARIVADEKQINRNTKCNTRTFEDIGKGFSNVVHRLDRLEIFTSEKLKKEVERPVMAGNKRLVN